MQEYRIGISEESPMAEEEAIKKESYSMIPVALPLYSLKTNAGMLEPEVK